MPVWNDAGAWCWNDDGGAMSKGGGAGGGGGSEGKHVAVL